MSCSGEGGFGVPMSEAPFAPFFVGTVESGESHLSNDVRQRSTRRRGSICCFGNADGRMIGDSCWWAVSGGQVRDGDM